MNGGARRLQIEDFDWVLTAPTRRLRAGSVELSSAARPKLLRFANLNLLDSQQAPRQGIAETGAQSILPSGEIQAPLTLPLRERSGLQPIRSTSAGSDEEPYTVTAAGLGAANTTTEKTPWDLVVERVRQTLSRKVDGSFLEVADADPLLTSIAEENYEASFCAVLNQPLNCRRWSSLHPRSRFVSGPLQSVLRNFGRSFDAVVMTRRLDRNESEIEYRRRQSVLAESLRTKGLGCTCESFHPEGGRSWRGHQQLLARQRLAIVDHIPLADHVALIFSERI